MSRTWHAEWAWTGEALEADVVLEEQGGRFVRVEPGQAVPPGATRLAGCTLPGLVNAHSHAFHRALRPGTAAHRATGVATFWAWREQMYRLVPALDPDRYRALARACYAEMALAGITAVGEFHYLHHQVDGRPYAEPNVMAEALREAARDAGIRLTLLDTAYLQANVQGGALGSVQRRFSDGDAERWVTRFDDLVATWEGDAWARPGAAVHSVRAVDPSSAETVGKVARRHQVPLHVHVSEQPAENDACLAHHGCSPVELFTRVGVLERHSTAVHATHLTGGDLDLLAAQGSTVCLCPTTERHLADGVGPARAMAGRGVPLALGSDSHAVIDLFEEARAVELDERLVAGTRGGLAADALLAAATREGARSLGWPDAGRLAAGQLADFVTVGFGSVRLAGTVGSGILEALVYAAAPADVTRVVVGGQEVVADGRHLLIEDVPGALADAIGAVV